MTDKPDVKQELKNDGRKDDSKVGTEVIADLDVPGEDADVLKGASGHIVCINRVQGS